MITKNTDRNIYCDYCKDSFRNRDGSFSPKVRPAAIRIDYIRIKSRVTHRYLCDKCLTDITELTSGYYSLHDQLKDALKKGQVTLDV